MEDFDSIENILDFAIEREQEAVDFYTDLASSTDNQAMKKTFEDFAAEEKSHKKKLQNVKGGDMSVSDMGRSGGVPNMRIAEYTVDVEPGPDMDYQEALIVAMNREKAAYRLYTDLAANVEDPDMVALFESLAQEEAKHKLKFEIEYDENILTEN